MASHKPTLIALTILFLSLNLSISHVTATITCPIVNEFCNRKTLAQIKDKCLKVFESDPRGANAPNKLAVFKIALEQGTAKVIEAEKQFSSMATTKPEIKTTLQSCVEHYKNVVNNFDIYKKTVLDELEIDTMSLSYDFDLAQLDTFNCEAEMKKGGVHDPALLQKAVDIVDYFTICYEITKVVTGTP